MKERLSNIVKLAGLSLALVCVTLQIHAEDPATANRNALEDCLRKMAFRAQVAFHTPESAGGVGGSFSSMVLSEVLNWPVNSYGAFVLSRPTDTSIRFTGTGREIGRDGINPIEVEITVTADSFSISHNN